MNIKYSRKEKILIVFYLFMIFFLGLGITFSYFLLADSAEKDSTRVYAGTLDINYVQGNVVNTEKLQPISEPDFSTTSTVYRNTFIVETNGTLDQTVEIGFDISENQFTEDMLRYALYTGEGTKLSTGYLNQGYVSMIENVYFKAMESRTFVLVIWLEEKPFEQYEQGNRLLGKILVNSKQYGY